MVLSSTNLLHYTPLACFSFLERSNKEKYMVWFKMVEKRQIKWCQVLQLSVAWKLWLEAF